MDIQVSNKILQTLETMQTKMGSMQNEISSMKEDFNKRFDSIETRLGSFEEATDKRFDSIENRVGSLEETTESIRNSVILIEVEHGKKLDALLDAYTFNSEKHIEYESRFSALENIVERQNLRSLAQLQN